MRGSWDVLTPAVAIDIYFRIVDDDRIQFAGEPATTEQMWLSAMRVPAASGAAWTDAWLASFAIARGLTVVSFDVGMKRWAGDSTRILRPLI